MNEHAELVLMVKRSFWRDFFIAGMVGIGVFCSEITDSPLCRKSAKNRVETFYSERRSESPAGVQNYLCEIPSAHIRMGEELTTRDADANRR
jgi:hypothetical protein